MARARLWAGHSGQRSLALFLFPLTPFSLLEQLPRFLPFYRWEHIEQVRVCRGTTFTRIGTPIERRNLLRDWYKVMEGSTLPRIRFHDLRQSAATLLFAQGVHPRTVMEILGHKDLYTTMRIYGHVVDRMKQGAATKIDELFRVATDSATRADIHQQVN